MSSTKCSEDGFDAERQRGCRSFVPPFYLRNPVLQTILSSLKLRNRKSDPFDDDSYEKVINAGEGIRLTGYYSENAQRSLSPLSDNSAISGLSASDVKKYSDINNKGRLLILLHGWEGSEKSAYLAACGRYFYKKGYSIFRLNLRDHGNSHHLNEGLFNGTLIDEVYSAVKTIISSFAAEKDIFIAGFSMGANFALRVASLAGREKDGIYHIKKVLAVNPPLNPLSATENIDHTILIKKYFLKKWRRSLAKKEAAFPDIYSFSELYKIKSCIGLTEILIDKYSEYNGLEDYFSRYALKKEFFKSIKIPVFIITAKDDPVIEVSDFEEIKNTENPFIDLYIEKYGGHCAYIKNIKLDTWLFKVMNEKMV